MGQIWAVVSSQANPRAGFWVADDIFRALAQSQAGSWIKAALQAPDRTVWLAERVSRKKRLWEQQQARGSLAPRLGLPSTRAWRHPPLSCADASGGERKIMLLKRTQIRKAVNLCNFNGWPGYRATHPSPRLPSRSRGCNPGRVPHPALGSHIQGLPRAAFGKSCPDL